MKRFRSPSPVALALAYVMGWAGHALAYDLKEAAQEAALHNPEVVSRWHAYREATIVQPLFCKFLLARS